VPVPLLQLDGVSHRYGTRPVVRDVSFDLRPGAIACLLGPSGCGKTTLLRLIAGFETPEQGSIYLEGRSISSRDRILAPEHRQMGMVFQDFALFPHLRIAANIAFGLRRDLRAARVEELLALTQLEGLGDRYPHQISGGQQQRVALARALAPRPRLVLLDEPFSGLDVTLRERLATEVRSILQRESTAAILVTHDQQEAFAFADEIGVVREGRIEQWGTARDLYHRPATRFVADFICEGVFLPGRIASAGVVTELGSHLVESHLLDGVGADAHVEVLIRPSDLLHDDASTLEADIVARAFRGAEILYTLRLPSGASVRSLVPSRFDHPVGARVGVRLAARHVVAFAADPASRNVVPAPTPTK